MTTSQETQSSGIAVTIYNQGSALVRDKRTFTLTKGRNILNFTDVASSIDSTSVNFKSLTDPEGTRVLEQNYIYDLVDSSALLNRYLDHEIQVTTEDGTRYTGILLSGRSGEIIMLTGQGQVVMVSQSQIRDIQFPALPEGLITRPTLRWLLYSAQAGENLVELTYMTYGMNWTADYNVLLSDTSLDLTGWVTLTNNSGTSYADAQVKLIAGEVNRLPEPTRYAKYAMYEMLEEQVAFSGRQVEERDFSAYKLYDMGRPVTIGNNETKQVEFVTGTKISALTYFTYDASPHFYGYEDIVIERYEGVDIAKIAIWSMLEFSTGKDSGLDAALPAGRMRVFQQDVDGAALLVGESTIDHTAKGETIRLFLGNPFDLVAERKQTDFHIVTGSVIHETYEIRLRNRKDSGDVDIRVPERLFRWSNCEILSSSMPYEKLDSSTIEFRPTVKAGEEVVITYTVQYNWPR